MVSSLRQLARDYFEGRIERPDYLLLRQQMLVSLPEHSPEQTTVESPESSNDIFQLDAGEQPSSDDLASALAGRDDVAFEPPDFLDASTPPVIDDDSTGAALQERIISSTTSSDESDKSKSKPLPSLAVQERSLKWRSWLLLLVSVVSIGVIVYVVRFG